uniref:Uncharacterized protein n=1 Tax=Romanomermis culicivorax TaxID=13658 RepID=A0A915L7L5_ROMCU
MNQNYFTVTTCESIHEVNTDLGTQGGLHALDDDDFIGNSETNEKLKDNLEQKSNHVTKNLGQQTYSHFLAIWHFWYNIHFEMIDTAIPRKYVQCGKS